jgi:hypothetical protein
MCRFLPFSSQITLSLRAARGLHLGPLRERFVGDALPVSEIGADRALERKLPAERVCQSLEGKTQKQKNPHSKGSLAYATWVFARLGGWTGYYGKPGPIVMLRGLTQFHAIKHGWSLRNV